MAACFEKTDTVGWTLSHIPCPFLLFYSHSHPILWTLLCHCFYSTDTSLEDRIFHPDPCGGLLTGLSEQTQKVNFLD